MRAIQQGTEPTHSLSSPALSILRRSLVRSQLEAVWFTDGVQEQATYGSESYPFTFIMPVFSSISGDWPFLGFWNRGRSNSSRTKWARWAACTR
jgi:hypothetical protein